MAHLAHRLSLLNLLFNKEELPTVQATSLPMPQKPVGVDSVASMTKMRVAIGQSLMLLQPKTNEEQFEGVRSTEYERLDLPCPLLGSVVKRSVPPANRRKGVPEVAQGSQTRGERNIWSGFAIQGSKYFSMENWPILRMCSCRSPPF